MLWLLRHSTSETLFGRLHGGLMVLHIVDTIRAKNLGRLGDRIQMLPELICNLWMMPACGQAWISVLVGFKF